MPSPVPTEAATAPVGSGNAPWALNLDFSGDLTAHVTGTAASDDTIHNECTGPDSARLGGWASTMAVTMAQKRYSLVVLVQVYKGAADFASGVNVEVSSEDLTQVWQNGPGDPVSFTVGPDETTGLLDAVLSNAATPAQKLKVSGHWSCQP